MEQLLNFINEINPYCTVHEDTLLLEERVLDSMGIMVLISMIETGYNISISEEDIKPDNFRNLSAIELLITKCLNKA